MNTNEFICQHIECDYYENGYCWGYAWPVENVKECDEWNMWKEANKDEVVDGFDTKKSFKGGK